MISRLGKTSVSFNVRFSISTQNQNLDVSRIVLLPLFSILPIVRLIVVGVDSVLILR